MKKLIVSTLLLAGVSFGFAKGTPVKTEKGKTTIINNNLNKKEVKSFHFSTKEEAEEFLKNRCSYLEETLTVETTLTQNGDGSWTYTEVITYEFLYIEWDC